MYIANIYFVQSPWAERIHLLNLCRGARPPTSVLGMTIQYEGEAPVLLELWGMWSTPSLPTLPDPLWHGIVAPDRTLSMGQVELNCVLMLNRIT